MKKIFVTLLVVGSTIGGFAGISQAATCISPDHAVWNDLNNKIVSCIPVAQWEKNIAEAASRNDKKLPYVVPGAIVTDEGGWQDSCPSWYKMGCVDTSKTDKYRQDMISLARQIIASGSESKFPAFAGWFKLAR